MITLNFLLRTSFACLTVFIWGLLFKIMHWPGAYFLMIFGGLGFFSFLFISSLAINFNKIKKL
jgi:hypothetical protein